MVEQYSLLVAPHGCRPRFLAEELLVQPLSCGGRLGYGKLSILLLTASVSVAWIRSGTCKTFSATHLIQKTSRSTRCLANLSFPQQSGVAWEDRQRQTNQRRATVAHCRVLLLKRVLHARHRPLFSSQSCQHYLPRQMMRQSSPHALPR